MFAKVRVRPKRNVNPNNTAKICTPNGSMRRVIAGATHGGSAALAAERMNPSPLRATATPSTPRIFVVGAAANPVGVPSTAMNPDATAWERALIVTSQTETRTTAALQVRTEAGTPGRCRPRDEVSRTRPVRPNAPRPASTPKTALAHRVRAPAPWAT